MLKPFPFLSNSCHLCPVPRLGQRLPLPRCLPPGQAGTPGQGQNQGIHCVGKFPPILERPLPPHQPRPSPADGGRRVDRFFSFFRAPPLRVLRSLFTRGGRGNGSRPRPGPAQAPAPRSGTWWGSADASLHVTLELGKHGGGHRVSAAAVPGPCTAARSGDLGLLAGQWLRAPLQGRVPAGRAMWPRAARFFARVGRPARGVWLRVRLSSLATAHCPRGRSGVQAPPARVESPLCGRGGVHARIHGHDPQMGRLRCPGAGDLGPPPAPGRRQRLRWAWNPLPSAALLLFLQGPYGTSSEKISLSTYPTLIPTW